MVDHKKVEQAIRLLLEGIGEDPDREDWLRHRTGLQECMKKSVAE